MMRITELKPLGKGRYEVYVNGEIAFVLYKGDLARYDLHAGDELEEDTRRQILEETLYKRAVNRVLFLLQSKDYTYHELEDKLRQGRYPSSVVDGALEEVQSYGYINDANYAQRYVECYLERKSLGKIKQELIRLADVLKHPDVYAALGVTAPKGLLLHGEPGVGKTLMAKALIYESGRKMFVCRKNMPDTDFTNHINKIFTLKL